MFRTIKALYQQTKNKVLVANAVKKGWITEDDYVAIIEAVDGSMAALVSEIRARVANGEDLRTIINALNLTDEEKWELEKQVKEG